jgi:hypothetical protein
MTAQCIRCKHDEDIIKASLFLFEHKHDLHPSFTTMDMVALLYTYISEGHLLYAADADNQVIGAAAYYHGTPEHDFKDKEVALVDIAVFAKAYRGTRLFVRGLTYMVNQIINEHPEVMELRLAALSENVYVSKLYSKFTTSSYSCEGIIGEENVFSVNIYNSSLKGSGNKGGFGKIVKINDSLRAQLQ